MVLSEEHKMGKPLRVKLEGDKLVVKERVELEVGDEVKPIFVDAEAGSASKKLDLYKLEYEQTQEHYRDGYRAVWTNFSYVTVAVAAILTFGSRTPLAFPLRVVVLIATGLWTFWWVATFRPLDDYGEKRADILERLEGEVNKILGERVLTHWTELNKHRRSRRFYQLRYLRVKHVVNAFSFLVLVIFLGALIQTARFGAATPPEPSRGSSSLMLFDGVRGRGAHSRTATLLPWDFPAILISAKLDFISEH